MSSSLTATRFPWLFVSTVCTKVRFVATVSVSSATGLEKIKKRRRPCSLVAQYFPVCAPLPRALRTTDRTDKSICAYRPKREQFGGAAQRRRYLDRSRISTNAGKCATLSDEHFSLLPFLFVSNERNAILHDSCGLEKHDCLDLSTLYKLNRQGRQNLVAFLEALSTSHRLPRAKELREIIAVLENRNVFETERQHSTAPQPTTHNTDSLPDLTAIDERRPSSLPEEENWLNLSDFRGSFAESYGFSLPRPSPAVTGHHLDCFVGLQSDKGEDSPPSCRHSQTRNLWKRCNNEQLAIAFANLSEEILNFFHYPINGDLMANEIIFENRMMGMTVRGMTFNVVYMNLLMWVGHICYSKPQVELLKITAHPEEGAVKARWRIRGTPRYLWPAKMAGRLTYGKTDLLYNRYIDGFSTFYIDDESKVYRHVCEKLMQDTQKQRVPATSWKERLTGLLRRRVPVPI